MSKESRSEFDFRNSEISMLTELIANKVATDNKQFKKFLNYTEVDFMIPTINIEKFVNKMLEDQEFTYEFIDVLKLNMVYLSKVYEFNISKYNITKDSKLKDCIYKNFKYKYLSDGIILSFIEPFRGDLVSVKIEYIDIIWELLSFRNKPIYQIIHELKFSAPFIDYVKI